MSTGRAPKAQHWSIRPHADGVVISPWYARSISPRTVILRSYTRLNARAARTQTAADDESPFRSGRSVR